MLHIFPHKQIQIYHHKSILYFGPLNIPKNGTLKWRKGDLRKKRTKIHLRVDVKEESVLGIEILYTTHINQIYLERIEVRGKIEKIHEKRWKSFRMSLSFSDWLMEFVSCHIYSRCFPIHLLLCVNFYFFHLRNTMNIVWGIKDRKIGKSNEKNRKCLNLYQKKREIRSSLKSQRSPSFTNKTLTSLKLVVLNAQQKPTRVNEGTEI